ncbi:Chymotrypsin-1 [Harpegnathos saltator]|uniref:Chymotrypsin-1 n=2 Tax=Harpegnathos saltator TaxID=610380 RepID=E2BE22_HARSA|nr:Chymotrypsin-1 [Harpegnathos saltator]
MNGQHFCSGSIINNDAILTAAHCVTELVAIPHMLSSVTVVSGSTYNNMIDNNGQRHRVKQAYYYPGYQQSSGRTPGGDIGILKLSQPMVFNERQKPVKLPFKNIIPGVPLKVVTWGAQGFRQRVHNDLRKIEGNSMEASECQRYHRYMKIDKLEFCILIRAKVGTCNGDSGGGVISRIDGTIVGLVSGGMPCAHGIPDVYTTVHPYSSWIRSIVSGI